jgi:hypothetical protein
MAAATLVSVEEYLSTSYDPDCDYVDGELEDRNVGGKRPQQSTGKHLHLFANGLSHPVHLNRTAFARVGYTLPCTRRLRHDWRARRGSSHPAALLVHRNPLAGGRRRTNPAKSYTTSGTHVVEDGFLRASDPDIAVPLAEIFD